MKRIFTNTGVMQTASGLPKKSLEERKVSSEGGRSKASGGKKEGPEAAASSKEAGLQGTRGAEEGSGEVGQRAEGGEKRYSSAFSSANPTRD